MTLMSGEKYNENKWKNGYGSGSLDKKPKTILTLRVSALLVFAVLVIVLLKFLVVLSK